MCSFAASRDDGSRVEHCLLSARAVMKERRRSSSCSAILRLLNGSDVDNKLRANRDIAAAHSTASQAAVAGVMLQRRHRLLAVVVVVTL